MFWSKPKPAAPSVVPPYDASALEKGKEPDRRSSFSSADSSSQSSPIKSLPTSLPQEPKATYTAPGTHSQTQSVNEHPADLQSFPVLSTNGHRNKPRGFIRRFSFVIIIAVLVTITIFGAIVSVMVKHRQGTVFYTDSETSGVPSSSYWIIKDGSIIHNPFDPVTTPTPTPTAS